MNERLFGYRIKHLLADNAAESAAVESRLRAAREAALARQRREQPRMAPAWILAMGRRISDSVNQPSTFALNLLLSVLLLALGAFVIGQFHERQTAAEIEEIDAAVLTGELPLDAYLDKGFDAWLKRSSSL